jgi:hypothetical protein
MTFLIIETALGKVKIKLLDNKFTQKYIPFLKVMFDTFEKEYRSGPALGYIRTIKPAVIVEETKRLIESIDELNAMGYNFPYSVKPDSFTKCDLEGQLLLNKLHRSFTTAQRDYYNNPPKFLTLYFTLWNDKFDSNFVVQPEDIDRLLYLTEIINDAVHSIEHYIITPRKTNDFNQIPKQLEIRALVINDIALEHKDKGRYESLSGWFKNYTKEDYELFSDSDEYDVWVGRDILGKDFIHAFYDHDDPTCWDVTGQLGYSGKIAIDMSPLTKTNIIKSEKFKQWLDEYNIPYSTKMGGMPLGTVIEGKDLLQKIYKGEILEKITTRFE